jgi:hypothetical protein
MSHIEYKHTYTHAHKENDIFPLSSSNHHILSLSLSQKNELDVTAVTHATVITADNDNDEAKELELTADPLTPHVSIEQSSPIF